MTAQQAWSVNIRCEAHIYTYMSACRSKRTYRAERRKGRAVDGREDGSVSLGQAAGGKGNSGDELSDLHVDGGKKGFFFSFRVYAFVVLEPVGHRARVDEVGNDVKGTVFEILLKRVERIAASERLPAFCIRSGSRTSPPHAEHGPHSLFFLYSHLMICLQP